MANSNRYHDIANSTEHTTPTGTCAALVTAERPTNGEGGCLQCQLPPGHLQCHENTSHGITTRWAGPPEGESRELAAKRSISIVTFALTLWSESIDRAARDRSQGGA